MKSTRGFHEARPLLVATMLLAGTALACKIGGSNESNSSPPVTDPNAPTNEVVRYGTMESVDTGQTTVRQPVVARKSADWSSVNIATLSTGTVVTKMARYGNFSLVRFSSIGGVQAQGWVDNTVAFNMPRVFVFDAGVPDPGTPGFVVTQPTPTVNTPPQPTVAQPPPPPPTTVTPPKTATPPPPPPPPPKTTTPPPPPPPTGKSFKPPKLH